VTIRQTNIPTEGYLLAEASDMQDFDGGRYIAPTEFPVDAITGAPISPGEVRRIGELRPALAEYLRQQYPSLKADDCVDRASVHGLLRRYILDLLEEDKGELTSLETEVADSIASRGTLTENTEVEYDEHESLGSRVADHVASFGGSWTFIIGFASFLAIWMFINVMLGTHDAFDAYPFILLNLVLSTIAAFQAPVIMMSQRRQEAKDRLRSNNDYQVNLKAELEIRRLHEKLDNLSPQLVLCEERSRKGARMSGRRNRINASSY
jgi:uncharacterized membrane protein